MPSAVDYAFPAADSTTVNTLANAGSLSQSSQDDFIKNIHSTERNNFLTSVNSSDGASNNTLTYAVMLSRNKTIDDVASDMTKRNLSLINGAKETYIRQGEINEWQAQNKLDTLFFLQIVFLFLTIILCLVFLRRYYIITKNIFWVFTVIFMIILLGTLWNRAAYTYQSRDQKSWNRRYIGLEDAGLSAAKKCET